MIKLALETLFSQALVYDRNPHDPSGPIHDLTPLKFTHLLIETNGTELLYDEKTHTVYTDIQRVDFDARYPELPFSLTVTEASRRSIDSLHNWMTNLEHYAVRLDYCGPRIIVKVQRFIDYLLKVRSASITPNPHVVKPEQLGSPDHSPMAKNIKLLISCDHESDRRVLVVYDNYEVREVLYNPFTGGYEIDFENEALVYAGPDAEHHYQQLTKTIARRPHRIYGRDTFAPQVTQSNPSDYIQNNDLSGGQQEDDGA